jgi:hypothetical protein
LYDDTNDPISPEVIKSLLKMKKTQQIYQFNKHFYNVYPTINDDWLKGNSESVCWYPIRRKTKMNLVQVIMTSTVAFDIVMKNL